MAEKNIDCSRALSGCDNDILSPLSGPWDIYYVLDRNASSYPPDFTNWLNSQATAIDANTTWSPTSVPVYNNFFDS